MENVLFVHVGQGGRQSNVVPMLCAASPRRNIFGTTLIAILPPPPRRRQIIAGPETDREGERDPLEDALLLSLGELAQKTEVLTNWGDEMYEDGKAIPQSKNIHMSFSVK